jgi:hypothetical protein
MDDVALALLCCQDRVNALVEAGVLLGWYCLLRWRVG